MSEVSLGKYATGVVAAILIVLAIWVGAGAVWGSIPDFAKVLLIFCVSSGVEAYSAMKAFHGEESRTRVGKAFWTTLAAVGAVSSFTSLVIGNIVYGLYGTIPLGLMLVAWYLAQLFVSWKLDSQPFYAITYAGGFAALVLSSVKATDDPTMAHVAVTAIAAIAIPAVPVAVSMDRPVCRWGSILFPAFAYGLLMSVSKSASAPITSNVAAVAAGAAIASAVFTLVSGTLSASRSSEPVKTVLRCANTVMCFLIIKTASYIGILLSNGYNGLMPAPNEGWTVSVFCLSAMVLLAVLSRIRIGGERIGSSAYPAIVLGGINATLGTGEVMFGLSPLFLSGALIAVQAALAEDDRFDTASLALSCVLFAAYSGLDPSKIDKLLYMLTSSAGALMAFAASWKHFDDGDWILNKAARPIAAAGAGVIATAPLSAGLGLPNLAWLAGAVCVIADAIYDEMHSARPSIEWSVGRIASVAMAALIWIATIAESRSCDAQGMAIAGMALVAICAYMLVSSVMRRSIAMLVASSAVIFISFSHIGSWAGDAGTAAASTAFIVVSAVLVFLGFRKHAGPMRVTGLISMMVGILKLILLDVPEMGGTRANALMLGAAGLICLAISFAYNKLEKVYERN
jgi:hypothetical protein